MNKCYINGKKFIFKKDSTILQILKESKKGYKNVLASKKNNKLCDLHEKVKDNDRISLLDIIDREGFKCYQNSLSFLLSLVVDKYFPQKKLVIEHSFSDGFYCRFANNSIVNKSTIEKIRREMDKKIQEKLPFIRAKENNKTIMKYFIENEKFDKVELMDDKKGEKIDYYRCQDFIDFSFTPLVPDTSYLNIYSLHLYKPGFVLRFPHPESKVKIPSFSDQKKLFDIFEEYERWAEILGADDIVSLNRSIEKGEISDLIKISEALHEKKIANIADEIKRKGSNLKIILIAGPSASGKTTFSKRLSVQLKVNCLSPMIISIDDYFQEWDETPHLSDGSFNFESIEAIDTKLLNEHLVSLLDGKEVEIPNFEFTTGKRTKGNIIKMHKNQVLIIEGIHGLNEKLTSQIPRENKYKIYISALTQLNIDSDHRISTRDTRIIRRMVRDKLYRNHSATETFHLWKQVEKGEEKNIFPFQEEANIMFNSALVYELSVLKKFCLPILQNVNPRQIDFSIANRLLKILSFFKTVSPKEVPSTSILREFIGGSSFLY
jgi:uridine kinase